MELSHVEATSRSLFRKWATAEGKAGRPATQASMFAEKVFTVMCLGNPITIEHANRIASAIFNVDGVDLQAQVDVLVAAGVLRVVTVRNIPHYIANW